MQGFQYSMHMAPNAIDPFSRQICSVRKSGDRNPTSTGRSSFLLKIAKLPSSNFPRTQTRGVLTPPDLEYNVAIKMAILGSGQAFLDHFDRLWGYDMPCFRRISLP